MPLAVVYVYSEVAPVAVAAAAPAAMAAAAREHRPRRVHGCAEAADGAYMNDDLSDGRLRW